MRKEAVEMHMDFIAGAIQRQSGLQGLSGQFG